MLGHVYIFIDAINEAQSSGLEILHALREVLTRCKNVRFFVTSTKLMDQGVSFGVPIETVQLDAKTLNDDIALFVTDGLSTNKATQKLDSAIKTAIENKLITSANGS